MKQIVLTLFLVFSLGTLSQAQSISVEKWQQADSQERKSMLKDMSPEQKKLFYKDLKENMLVEELKVPAKDRESFKRMYSEYQDSQRRIKEGFSHDFDPDKLSDQQAREKLEESFRYGERMIDTRREYARKMQGVIGPQQVLKMFKHEGEMRDRMLERRIQSRTEQTAPGSGMRNSNPGEFRSSPQHMRPGQGPVLRTPAPSGMRSGSR